MKIKRVIFICNYAANYGGNFLASLEYLSSFLYNENICVEYIFPVSAQGKCWNADLSGFKIHYCTMEASSLKHFLKGYLQNGDLIHTHFLNERTLLGIKNSISFKKNVKVIEHEHMDLDPHKGKIYEFAKKVFMFTNFLKMGHIAVSPSVYKRLRSIYGAKRVFLVENAISTKRLDEKSTDPFHKDDRKQLTIMGTDYTRKGVDIAIKAISQNSELSNLVNLNVVTHTVNETRELIRDQFGTRVFKFVSVIPTDTRVQDFYNNSVAFLSPSRHEAFGYANVEAAYCGTQVIASDVPGQNTLKKIPYISWIPSENAKKLSQALLSVINKPQKVIEKEACENKKYIIKNYSLDDWSKKVYEVYRKVTEN